MKRIASVAVAAAALVAAHAPADGSERLASDDALRLVAATDADAAGLLARHPAEFRLEPLPFYTGADLLSATALLPQHPVQWRFVRLRDPAGPTRAAAPLLPLGTPERVLVANAAAGLRLSPRTALDYLSFWLASSGGAPATRPRLVTSAQRLPWLPGASARAEVRAARARVASRLPTPRVEQDPDGGLRISAAALQGRRLDVATWRVSTDGQVTRLDASMLADDLPVAVVQ